MYAIKAEFDGKQINLPSNLPSAPAGEVIVIFSSPPNGDSKNHQWMQLQESAFSAAWNNDEDAAYDDI